MSMLFTLDRNYLEEANFSTTHLGKHFVGVCSLIRGKELISKSIFAIHFILRQCLFPELTRAAAIYYSVILDRESYLPML